VVTHPKIPAATGSPIRSGAKPMMVPWAFVSAAKVAPLLHDDFAYLEEADGRLDPDLKQVVTLSNNK
jgi:hypothetical protein